MLMSAFWAGLLGLGPWGIWGIKTAQFDLSAACDRKASVGPEVGRKPRIYAGPWTTSETKITTWQSLGFPEKN